MLYESDKQFKKIVIRPSSLSSWQSNYFCMCENIFISQRVAQKNLSDIIFDNFLLNF